jgi:predicted transcriptional regulator of viral defense system
MIFLEFKNKLFTLGAFSLTDIQIFYPDFDHRRLFEWQEKGYIMKLRNGWYCFTDIQKGEQFTYFVANRIYSPSYISLESALSYHHIIPEAVYSTCSVTTNKTMIFDTKIGEFRYNTLKANLFFGYEITNFDEKPVKIAYPEKAFLDFLYLRKQYDTDNEFIELRFSLENISTEKLYAFLEEFKNHTLEKRVKNLIKAYANV